MSQPLIALSLWLHSVATVVLIGHFLLLSLVYLPYLSVELDGLGVAKALDAISRRMRPWLTGSLLVFAVTGAYLMLVNQSYEGIGRFGNAWSLLMLVKHVLVVALIGLVVFLNAAVKRAMATPTGDMSAGSGSPAGLTAPRLGKHAEAGRPRLCGGEVRLAVNALAICGVLVLLLTAIAQAA